MIQKTLQIVNKKGMHARAAAAFAKEVDGFKSDVMVEKDHKQVVGNSILGLLLLAASEGTEIIVTVTGKDEEKAMEAIEKLVADKFGENE